MSLIACGECGNQVSDKAAACPKCGNPIATNLAPADDDSIAASAPWREEVEITKAPVITTEATGKGYKVAQLVGCILMLLGMWVACTAQNPAGSGVLFVTGALILLGARFGAWWNHG